ncbi:MAG: uroporphyrinogen decarboxylase family protein [Treponema sp.]|jgi:MtaA/CmuA family methyltransferase|nr:uroporphyrinogen decarboxylase family protein [Treponema sp.]
MAYSGVLDDIRAATALKIPKRLPVFACSEEFDVRIYGAVYNEYNNNAKLMADCQIAAIRRFDYDWAWLQVDDCIEFETLGVGVQGEGNILPATCRYLPAKPETLRNLRIPSDFNAGRMPVLLEAISRIKEAFGDTVCVTGRTAAPFSSVALLFGIEETMMACYDDPGLIREAVKKMTEYQTAWGLAQIKADADALWFGDCNASGHLLSPEFYEEFALDGAKTCTEAYKNAGGLVFYHASEHSIPHLKLQVRTGVSAISVGPGLDMNDAKAAIGGDVCLLGNVDPINTLLYGTPEKVREDSLRIIAAGGKNGGYLFNSGEMIPRDVPEANMKAFVAAGREAGKPLTDL